MKQMDFKVSIKKYNIFIEKKMSRYKLLNNEMGISIFRDSLRVFRDYNERNFNIMPGDYFSPDYIGSLSDSVFSEVAGSGSVYLCEEGSALVLLLFERLDWDSKFFDRNIYSLKVYRAGDLSSSRFSNLAREIISNVVSEFGIEQICAKIIGMDSDLYWFLNDIGFHHIDSRSAYYVDTNIFSPSLSDYSRSLSYTKDNREMLFDFIDRIAYDSRYTRDPFYSQDKSSNIARSWVSEVVKDLPQYNLCRFVHRKAEITAFSCAQPCVVDVSGKKITYCGRVMAGAIKQNSLSRGVDALLAVESMTAHCLQGYEAVEAVISDRNVPASRLVSSIGYVVHRQEACFHLTTN